MNKSEQVLSDNLAFCCWKRVQQFCQIRGWSLSELAERASVSRSTFHQWQQGQCDRPQNATLSRIAAAFGVSIDELLNHNHIKSDLLPSGNPSLSNQTHHSANWEQFSFDEQSNWCVKQVHNEHPEWFQFWREEDWQELLSCFGTGGPLNEEGVRAQVQSMNQRRETLHQLKIILETHLADVARNTIQSLYDTLHAQTLGVEHTNQAGDVTVSNQACGIPSRPVE